MDRDSFTFYHKSAHSSNQNPPIKTTNLPPVYSHSISITQQSTGQPTKHIRSDISVLSQNYLTLQPTSSIILRWCHTFPCFCLNRVYSYSHWINLRGMKEKTFRLQKHQRGLQQHNFHINSFTHDSVSSLCLFCSSTSYFLPHFYIYGLETDC
jgi:hypothetical protein